MAARARPPLDEKEMIKIFVDTLKNPYFNRMIGIQLQFFVDLIPVGERIEDAIKTKKIVDMSALMSLAEQTAKRTPMEKEEGEVQLIAKNNRKQKKTLQCFIMQSIWNQPRPTQIAQAPSRVTRRITHYYSVCQEGV
jgi:hypothetical protein